MFKKPYRIALYCTMLFLTLLALFIVSCSDGKDGQTGKAGESSVVTICENGNWCINGEDTGVSARGETGPKGPEGPEGKSIEGPEGQSIEGEPGADGSVVSICGDFWCINGDPTGVRVKDQNCSLTPDASATGVAITCDDNPLISINSCQVKETEAFITVICGTEQAKWSKGFDPEMLTLTPGETTAELNLNWWSTHYETVSGEDALVRLYDANEDLIETFEGTAKKVDFTGIGTEYLSGKGRNYHRVTIIDLAPNTSYKYSISSNGLDWSKLYDYKTPATGSFKFAAVADAQLTASNTVSNGFQDEDSDYSSLTTARGWRETVAGIAAKGASLIVSAGDQVDRTQYSEHEYEHLFAPSALRNIPLAPSLGNHDMHCQYFDHYNMPNLQNKPEPGTCTGQGSTSHAELIKPGIGNYYYLYNNILFVALNTAPYPQSVEGTGREAKPLVDKFDENIKAAKAAHPTYDWLIVQHHKSTQSIANHASDNDIDWYLQAGFEKIMSENGVDLVISGHDHIYVRSHLMVWDGDAERKCADNDGTNVRTCDSPKPAGYSVRSTNDKGTIYLALTTGSGLKYYALFESGANNENIPVLVDFTAGRTQHRLNYENSRNASIYKPEEERNLNKYPLGLDFYDQSLTPSYTIFEVNGPSMNVTTYGISGTQFDNFTITPKGNR